MWKTIFKVIKEAPKYIGAIVTLWEYAKRLLPKKKGSGMPNKTAFENLIRSIFQMVLNYKNLSMDDIMEIALSLISDTKAAYLSVKDKSQDEVRQVVADTLDNMIGNEDDALFSMSLPVIGRAGFEKLSDVIIGIASDRIAKAIVA